MKSKVAMRSEVYTSDLDLLIDDYLAMTPREWELFMRTFIPSNELDYLYAADCAE